MIHLITLALTLWFCLVHNNEAYALSSANVPLDSPIYLYLEKLAGYGLTTTDFRGIRPYSKVEVARLVRESEAAAKSGKEISPLFMQIVDRLKTLVSREYILLAAKEEVPLFDYTLLDTARLRYVQLDGMPRSFERQVHDPGGDGVFGIGSGLRPDNTYPSPAQQRGTEGTPLFPNNEGIRYRRGENAELRFAGEAHASRYLTALMEPLLIYGSADGEAMLRLNKGYMKFGGGGLELELGRDANWLGLGSRGNITLTNNAQNFDLLKLSSPEPITLGSWGMVKYSLIASRFNRTVTAGVERQPWFYALKFSYKPADNWEVGFNLGRQVGGPGGNTGGGDTIRGLIGGTNSDNSNGLAGFEVRYRAHWLRNTEFYGEFSGEDTASFWPIVESYVAGFFIPNLTKDGRDDIRFEYFLGNQILYTNGTFPEGYLYDGMQIGHSQGGAAQDFFVRYSHWFSTSNTLALEYFHGNRGKLGKMPGQVTEYKNAGRIVWRFPLDGDLNAELLYGYEQIDNLNLTSGENRHNQLFKMDISYRY
jgi:hypothetical protein